MAGQLGDNVALVRMWNNLACVSLGIGDWAEAGCQLRQAEAIQSTISSNSDLSIPVALNMANLAFYQGQLSEARDRYAHIEDLCERQQSPEYVPEVVSCLGLVALQRGDRVAAHDYWNSLRMIQDRIGPAGSQERFKAAWFDAVMSDHPLDSDVLVEAAAAEESKDVPGHLKLLMLDSILYRQSEADFVERSSRLRQEGMSWFPHFARRWHRMARVS